jgi:hypothetical protein
VTEEDDRCIRVLAMRAPDEDAEVRDEVVEPLDIGAPSGRAAVAAMIDRVDGMTLVYEAAASPE